MRKAVYSLKANKKAKFPLVSKRHPGICSCCEGVHTCAFNRDPKRPILECGEFIGIVYSPPEMKAKNNPSLPNLQRNPLSLDDPDQPYKGLCRTCEERATCTYQKNEGGVWHCEEFR